MKKFILLFAGLIISFFIPVCSNAQINWEKYGGNPVLNPDSVSWSSHAAIPVVIFEDQVFKMWFLGLENISNYWCIGYAESSDGLNWDVDEDPVIGPGSPGAWDEERMPGSVIRVNDTLKMWYFAAPKNENALSIGYGYYSEDSGEWILNPDPVLEKGDPGSWDAGYALCPSVHYDGQTYHMWYSGSESTSSSTPAVIGYATSQDGINWVKDNLNNPVITTGPDSSFYSHRAWAPRVLFYADTFHMWFAGWDGFSTNPIRYFRIGYATSPDGIEWEVQNNDSAVVDVGEPGDWDDHWVRYCSVLIHENRLKMWYDGRGDERMIGYALGDSIPSPQGITDHRSELMSTVYPNPCSGTTCLRYHIKVGSRQSTVDSQVSLCVYDIHGQRIKRILNREMMPGEYELKIDMSDLPAGVYFCTLQTEEGMETMKVVKY
jgi:predicted GH43/DUF377 family glycosyl hydrolase